jgi:hypothetical protein
MSVSVWPGRVDEMSARPGRARDQVRDRVGEQQDQEQVRVECLPAAPAPLDLLDDGEDYVPAGGGDR